jgi:hypothetical protein
MIISADLRLNSRLFASAIPLLLPLNWINSLPMPRMDDNSVPRLSPDTNHGIADQP